MQTSSLLSIRSLLTAVLVLIKCKAMADFLIKSYFPKRSLMGFFFSLSLPHLHLYLLCKVGLKNNWDTRWGHWHEAKAPGHISLQNGCVVIIRTILYSSGFVKWFWFFKKLFCNVFNFVFFFSSQMYFLPPQFQQKEKLILVYKFTWEKGEMCDIMYTKKVLVAWLDLCIVQCSKYSVVMRKNWPHR